jgi:hypothetical protein
MCTILRDEDQPDYQHLRKMFIKLFRQRGFEYDNVFDWTIWEFQRLEPDIDKPPASKDASRETGGWLLLIIECQPFRRRQYGGKEVSKANRWLVLA